MLIVYKIKMRSWALEILSDREIKVPWDCFSESMIDQKVTKDQHLKNWKAFLYLHRRWNISKCVFKRVEWKQVGQEKCTNASYYSTSVNKF